MKGNYACVLVNSFTQTILKEKFYIKPLFVYSFNRHYASEEQKTEIIMPTSCKLHLNKANKVGLLIHQKTVTLHLKFLAWDSGVNGFMKLMQNALCPFLLKAEHICNPKAYRVLYWLQNVPFPSKLPEEEKVKRLQGIKSLPHRVFCGCSAEGSQLSKSYQEGNKSTHGLADTEAQAQPLGWSQHQHASSEQRQKSDSETSGRVWVWHLETQWPIATTTERKMLRLSKWGEGLGLWCLLFEYKAECRRKE